jgi:D-beta-D-heptose 7-phosphate kinase/D-beta-D-heptose 1-phosphate adenosyltransferase
MDSLLTTLSAWKPFRALVVGDFMLDELLFGDAERLSADAPVPVLLVRSREHRPGGSANVCLDLAALRGSVVALGVVGCDDAGLKLRKSLESAGVDASGLIEDDSRPTTRKLNLIGLAQARHPQKMFRVDFESAAALSEDVTHRLLEAFDRLLPTCDVVCIEDYNKGVCSNRLCREVISRARAKGKGVYVDPARLSDYSKYAGATVITPNRTEAETATALRTPAQGDAQANAAHNAELAHRLLEKLDLDAVVLTLDKHGALLLERGGRALAVPTQARQVYDVTGAGDMFLAALAAARANGCAWPDATRFANAAAGLEVEIFGVEPIALEKVHVEILSRSREERGKLRSWDEACLEVAAARLAGRKVVFTNGCFDLLHSGHVTLLEKARAAGGPGALLVVGLNDDASVRRLKGPTRPVNTQEDRARVLGALESVGCVVVFGEDTPLKLIETIRPDVLVKGADYTRETVVGASFVESIGGRVELVNLVEGKSTTAALKKLGGG